MGKALQAPDGQTVTHSGTLMAAAQVRFTPIDSEGRMAPVLCMTVALDSFAGVVMQLEQCFQTQGVAQCQAAARRYRAGMRVTVVAPVYGLKISARFVEHIHVHRDDSTPTQPNQNPAGAAACPL